MRFTSSIKVISWFTFLSLSSFVAFGGRARAQEATELSFVNGDPLPGAPELTPRGPYSVGVRTLNVTNADQVDVLGRMGGDVAARYDRPLTVEVWYPALIPEGQSEQVQYSDALPASADEPAIPFVTAGRALRDAAPDASAAPYPLIVVAHGYPGSRFQLAYLTENLASKGYVVAAIDHTDSTNADVGAFQSTLFNRPLDIRFTIDEMERFSADSNSFLSGLLDAQNTGLVGYSMGGYGALNVAGAGFNGVMRAFVGDFAAPLLANNPAFAADSRVKAVVALAPFGADLSIAGAPGRGFWDVDALAAIRVPVFFMAGQLDDVAGYEDGPRHIFEAAANSKRYLLTFENARHNIGAAPPPLAATSYENWVRYGEPAWDNRRLNNIVQHFTTAFMGLQLQGRADYQRFLDMATDIGAAGENGEWPGFPPRSTVGLRLEQGSP